MQIIHDVDESTKQTLLLLHILTMLDDNQALLMAFILTDRPLMDCILLKPTCATLQIC
jgi:hypothetical protein